MSIYSGNKNATGDFMRVADSIKQKTLSECHCCEVCKIISETTEGFLCQTLSQQYNLTAMAVQDLELSVNDFVVVIFNDSDFRTNLKKAKLNSAISPVTSNLHTMSYGIIIAKI